MKVLVTGATGLIGREVVFAGMRSGNTVYTGWHERRPEYGTPVQLDITNGGSIHKAFETDPDVVIHLAALTDVDGCELDEASACELNHLATEKLATEANDRGVHFIFVSTDYVFDGNKGLYSEDDSPRPVNRYGWSKLRGEEAVRATSKNWCIVRTSTPYGLHPLRRSFAVFLAEKLAAREEVSVVSDQFTSPTYTVDLSATLLEIAKRRTTGLLHVSGSERCSRLDFAIALAKQLSLDVRLIRPILMSEIQWKAVRPRDSSLNVDRATGLLESKPKPLPDSLRRFAEQYTEWQTKPEAFRKRDN